MNEGQIVRRYRNYGRKYFVSGMPGQVVRSFYEGSFADVGSQIRSHKNLGNADRQS